MSGRRHVKDQVVVVAGASSGIGRAAALRFAAEGARVVVSARSLDGLDSLVREIKDTGGEGTAVVADVTDPAAMRAVADQAVATYGRLDTWVHVAGVLLVAALEDTTPEEFARVIDVNLLGQVHGAMAALPHLRRDGGGALIHVSSMGAKRGIPLQSAYTASKHGVDGFLEAIRVEFRHDKVPVTVTNVMPATINTPLFDNARTKLGVKPIAPPPVYPPELVADAILFAARHPVRDIVVGGAAKTLITAQAAAPRLVDAVMRRAGYRVHFTDDPKPEDAPDNLFAPLPAHDTVTGTVGDHARQHSVWTAIETRPALRYAMPLAGGAAVTAAVLTRLRARRGRARGNRPLNRLLRRR
ncbi:SDR family oxidoreductase [Actinoplanes sp. URMC 104]|uniref:SDR family oxidoreductase n=1 Tax=Actinoplanes sp. URMC 104 TaxID=3423409 RepID=UPI003F1C8E7F